MFGFIEKLNKKRFYYTQDKSYFYKIDNWAIPLIKTQLRCFLRMQLCFLQQNLAYFIDFKDMPTSTKTQALGLKDKQFIYLYEETARLPLTALPQSWAGVIYSMVMSFWQDVFNTPLFLLESYIKSQYANASTDVLSRCHYVSLMLPIKALQALSLKDLDKYIDDFCLKINQDIEPIYLNCDDDCLILTATGVYLVNADIKIADGLFAYGVIPYNEQPYYRVVINKNTGQSIDGLIDVARLNNPDFILEELVKMGLWIDTDYQRYLVYLCRYQYQILYP